MNSRRSLVLALLPALLMTPLAARAQAAPAATAPAAGPQLPRITRILVGSATDLGVEAESRPAHLGLWLTLDVAGLDQLVAKARAAKKPLQLYLNGMPLNDVPPVYLNTNGKPSRVRFALFRTENAKLTWSALLGRPRAQNRIVEASVGLTGCAEGCADITDGFKMPLAVIRPVLMGSYLALLAVGLWLVIRLARTTPILRNHGPGSPWSLDRIQMAWWTLLVVSAFVFIWLISGDYGSLSNSVLALIGISAGTGLIGSVMDHGKQEQVQQRKALEDEEAGLEAGNAQPAADAAAAAAAPRRPAEIEAQLAKLPKLKQNKSLWIDILSDENGVSFHRLQVMIWTLVLSVIFVVSVYQRLDMPDFDNQLLALMGISNGTYLGFKLPEKTA
ncbi:MAG TPA: hypothetical protein VHB47_14100 [Thermoanaerobaculia bacterium]|jgi:hypothetical protein|nr:hypothetical protein [Thermoanaerobaculia bacterium]